MPLNSTPDSRICAVCNQTVTPASARCPTCALQWALEAQRDAPPAAPSFLGSLGQALGWGTGLWLGIGCLAPLILAVLGFVGFCVLVAIGAALPPSH